MGTEIAHRVEYPEPTPQVAKSLSPQALHEHRAGIASEVKVVLSAYFQPHEADEIRAAQLAWWCDELQDWERVQVVWALREWNRQNPRLRPTPGDILRLCMDARGKAEWAKIKPILALPQEPERPPVTDESRLRMQAAAAEFIGGHRAMPRAGIEGGEA
jgi:hypothetical protein